VLNAVTPTSLRLAPPLLVSDAEIDEAVGVLAAVLADALRGVANGHQGGDPS
jgi:acetylornithine aminotransferase